MVKETIKIDSGLDLVFEQQTQPLTECSTTSDTSSIQDLNSQLHRETRRSTLAVNAELCAGSNFSWEFFDHDDSSDNQLNSELMTISPTSNEQIKLGNVVGALAIKPENIIGNIPTTTNFAIVQQSPDVICHSPSKENHINALTSPTTTYDRNQRQFNKNINNNNNNNQFYLKINNQNQPSNIFASDLSPTVNSFLTDSAAESLTGRSNAKEERQGSSDIVYLERNDTMMIGKSPGAGTDISYGTTTRSAHLRNFTLPSAVSSNRNNHGSVFSTDVDLVGGSSTSRSCTNVVGQTSAAAAGRVKAMGASSHHRQVNQMGNTSFADSIDYRLGLRGWRKKCLYTLVLLLMLLIVVNLALTLWILKVMEFTMDGMGQLRIVPGGIQVSGQTIIMDILRASTIRSKHGQPLSIESSRNFSIYTRDANGILENHLFLGHDKLECLTTEFRINDTSGRNLFSVNRDEVTIGAHALRIDGEGGAIFRESIQTPHVRAEAGKELRLESPTRQLEMTAAKDINLQSRAGGIELSALEDVKLSALEGSIRLESPKVMMPHLRTVQPATPGTGQNHEHSHRVFQLCVCSNGKLFLASPHSICAVDDASVCR